MGTVHLSLKMKPLFLGGGQGGGIGQVLFCPHLSAHKGQEPNLA
jgi:hypothetical protein